MLAGATGKLFIVGDDDQSIYGWRGAKIENIRRFDEDFSDVKTVRLEQNYRSTNVILKAANALIAHNQDRMGKNLWSAGEDGEPIQIYEAFNEQDEARYICNQIEAWCEQGGSRSEIAVLYRSNAQSRVMEQALLQAQIPYRVYGGLRFYDRAEIKDVLAYLRLLISREDDAPSNGCITIRRAASAIKPPIKSAKWHEWRKFRSGKRPISWWKPV